MGHRLSRLSALVPAVTLLTALVATPASAHNSNSHWEGSVASGVNRCVYGIDDQNHGGLYLSRSVQTFSMLSGCSGSGPEGTGQIAQMGWVYKTHQLGQPGTLCVKGGWQYSTHPDAFLQWQTNDDLWSIPPVGCNYGAGVDVVITHDIWHAVVGSSSEGWLVGSKRPATYHCHCP